MAREARVERETLETKIVVSLNLDGTGRQAIDTGVGFFDHMLTHLATHGVFDLEITAEGDVEVDDHHLVEDVGIVLGQAFAQAVGNKSGMVRFGQAACPLDEALVMVALDFSGRPYLSCSLNLPCERVGDFDTELAPEFFRAFAHNAKMALHIIQQAGENTHHILESAFKSLGRALDQATRIDERVVGVPSTKGTLT
ncbi:MAG: imidazoleglycerol-phosphate dehydratase HisB [Candidatus Zipacnadales bacterium]